MKQALKRLLLLSQNTQVNQQNIKQNEAYYGKKQKDSKYKKPSDNYEEVSKPLKLLDKDDIKLRSIWNSKLHWANKNYPHFEEYSQIAEKEFK